MDNVTCRAQPKTTPDDQLQAGKSQVGYKRGGHPSHIISFRGNFEYLEAVAITSLRKYRGNALSLEWPARSVLTLDAELDTEAEEKGQEDLLGGNKNIDTLFIPESWRCSRKIRKDIWEVERMGVILGYLLSDYSYQEICQVLRKQR